jgi:ammonium transporter, Amt family
MVAKYRSVCYYVTIACKLKSSVMQRNAGRDEACPAVSDMVQGVGLFVWQRFVRTSVVAAGRLKMNEGMSQMKKWSRCIFTLTLLMLPSVAFAADTAAPSTLVPADMAYVAFAGLMVFFMTPTLGIFYSGMVRRKNVLNTLMMSFIACGIIVIQWVLYGYSLSFGDDIGGVIGGLNFAGFQGVGLTPNPAFSETIPHMEFAVFQMMFAVITPAIISGSVAERIPFKAYMLFILLWATFVYDPMCHMVWGPGGLLAGLGALDFAGGTVIHISSGVSGLVAALVIGRRYGYGSQSFVPHNVPYILFGASVVWMGWFGFNSGCALGANEIMVLAFTNTGIASAAAMLMWVLLDYTFHGKATLFGAITGAIAGLVGITPGAGFVENWAAIPIGMTTSAVCFFAITFVKKKLGYDDSLDAFGCHGVGGMWGALVTGVFACKAVNPLASDGLVYGNAGQLIPQLTGVITTIFVATIVTIILLKLISVFTPIRVSETEEKEGLDLNEHGENAYSKF